MNSAIQFSPTTVICLELLIPSEHFHIPYLNTFSDLEKWSKKNSAMDERCV
eukprot:c28041_g2_i1 orf=351-503(+)